MPTYDYRCERTGEIFEVTQSFTDDALTVCPRHHEDADGECGAPVKKVFSSVGIAFKGEGFYKTDHGAGAAARKSDNGSPTDGSSSETGSSAKSDTKSDAKNDSKRESKRESKSDSKRDSTRESTTSSSSSSD